jgi:nucleotide-binding universal stress UspA family protein
MATMTPVSASARFAAVLCPVDFSEHSAAALRDAVALARPGGSVHVLYVNDPLLVTTAAIALGDRSLAATSREELSKFVRESIHVRSASASGIRCHVAKGNPARIIAAAAGKLHCDVIVMGTHGLSGIDKVIVGSTTERVLRRSSIPILAIPPALEAIGPQAPGRTWPGPTIMAPIDLGSDSARDIRDVAELVRAFDVNLLLLHVVPQLQLPRWYRADLTAQAQLRIEKAKRQLEGLAKAGGKGLQVEAKVRCGSVPDEIALAAAAERVGLVVMRLRKGPGLFGSRAGSIAYHILRHASTPVLALPPRPRSRSGRRA